MANIFQSTPPSPFQGGDNCLGIHYHRAAVVAWDKLIELGFQPATIIDSDIYMRRSDFMDLILDLGGKCSTKQDKTHRTSCVWMNAGSSNDLMVKIVFKEWIDQDEGEWYNTTDWQPLR